MTHEASDSPALFLSDLDGRTVVRTGADVLALICSVMGGRPRESLALMLVDERGAGPVLRVDLPIEAGTEAEGPEALGPGAPEPGAPDQRASAPGVLDRWCAELRVLVEELCSESRWTEVFLVACTGRTHFLCPADRPHGLPGFLVGPETALPLLHAEAMFWSEGVRAREAWVLDENGDRWGRLPLPAGGPGEEDEISMLVRPLPAEQDQGDVRPGWFVEHQGALMDIDSSAVAVSLMVEGSRPSGWVGSAEDGLPLSLAGMRLPEAWWKEARRALSAVDCSDPASAPRERIRRMLDALERTRPAPGTVAGASRPAEGRLALMAVGGCGLRDVAGGLLGVLGPSTALVWAALGRAAAEHFLEALEEGSVAPAGPAGCREALELLSGRRRAPVDLVGRRWTSSGSADCTWSLWPCRSAARAPAARRPPLSALWSPGPGAAARAPSSSWPGRTTSRPEAWSIRLERPWPDGRCRAGCSRGRRRPANRRPRRFVAQWVHDPVVRRAGGIGEFAERA